MIGVIVVRCDKRVDKELFFDDLKEAALHLKSMIGKQDSTVAWQAVDSVTKLADIYDLLYRPEIGRG